MTHGRKRLAALFAILCLVPVAVLVSALPATADPDEDIDTVKAKVEQLNRDAEIASERYNDANELIKQSQSRLDSMRSNLKDQETIVTQMRDDVASFVVDQYQTQTLSTASQLVLSNDPDVFIDGLNAVSTFNDQRALTMERYTTQVERLSLRQSAVESELAKMRKLREKLGDHKADIQKKASKAQDLLDELEAEQVQELVGPAYSGPLPSAPDSGRAAVAIKYAMAQVGKSYSYGAMGPNAFDCSGLMMRAWGAAGVGLPHSSRAQFGVGTRIAESQLRPGDLVFYYSPISHVGMYIGNGMIVNALNPGAGVRVSGLHSMPYVGAVRVG